MKRYRIPTGLSVIVILAALTSTVPLPSSPAGNQTERVIVLLESDVVPMDAGRADHADIIQKLRASALGTQSPVLTFLEIERRLGRVRAFRSFWIVNAVWVEAERSVIRELSHFYGVTDVRRVLPLSPSLDFFTVPAGDGVTVDEGITAVGADSLWSLGLTGLGRIGCIVDTGVDGEHPALAGKWRGAMGGVEWYEAWFDPVGGTDLPVDDDGHGTFMTGLVLGSEAADTVGVAPDAVWIAARAIGGDDFIADLLASLQWATDPDGDPQTQDDVPDVLPFTWSFPGFCDDLLWEAIDNLESAGVTVITSVGGYGPGSGTVGSPADRIESPVNCFSVGAVDASDPDFPVASFSSRGPSGCDGQTIKPEIVCPGVNVKSTTTGGGYAVWSGTSLSTAYTAGGVLLLAQSQPGPGVVELKESMLAGAMDIGDPGEDNASGHGLMFLPAALEELGGFVPVPVDIEPEYLSAQPGDTIDMQVSLANLSSFSETFRAYLGVKPPAGQGFVLDNRTVTLDPASSIVTEVPLRIPVKAPAGDYQLVGLTATLPPFTVIDSDTVVVTVTEASRQ